LNVNLATEPTFVLLRRKRSRHQKGGWRTYYQLAGIAKAACRLDPDLRFEPTKSSVRRQLGVSIRWIERADLRDSYVGCVKAAPEGMACHQFVCIYSGDKTGAQLQLLASHINHALNCVVNLSSIQSQRFHSTRLFSRNLYDILSLEVIFWRLGPQSVF